jgi:hypothetical protein
VILLLIGFVVYEIKKPKEETVNKETKRRNCKSGLR